MYWVKENTLPKFCRSFAEDAEQNLSCREYVQYEKVTGIFNLFSRIQPKYQRMAMNHVFI